MHFGVSPLEMILPEPQMEIWHKPKDRVLTESCLQRHRASHVAWVIQENLAAANV